jgi:hypothetical protein
VLLDKWCVTTKSPEIAAVITRILGGEARSRAEEIVVQTDLDAIDIIIDEASDITACVILASCGVITPYVRVEFRIAGVRNLGRFRFSSGSWELAAQINKLSPGLARVKRPMKGRLRLDRATHPRAVVELEI